MTFPRVVAQFPGILRVVNSQQELDQMNAANLRVWRWASALSCGAAVMVWLALA